MKCLVYMVFLFFHVRNGVNMFLQSLSLSLYLSLSLSLSLHIYIHIHIHHTWNKPIYCLNIFWYLSNLKLPKVLIRCRAPFPKKYGSESFVLEKSHLTLSIVQPPWLKSNDSFKGTHRQLIGKSMNK